MTSVYTEKKSSGVDWLGEIPRHWNVSALKRVLAEPLKYGATEAGDCDDRSFPRYLRITDFDNDGSLRIDTFASLPEEIASGYSVNEGDVLFARSGATVGKTFLFRNYQGRACFAGYLIKASPARHKLTSEFLYYFTKSPAYEAWKDFIFTQATIQNIGADKYAYLPVCLPPLPEQTRIAAFLDASCAAVDAAVAAKRRQLETLAALRKTIVDRTVTYGIAADPKLRRVNNEWLKEVPTHWEVCRVKRVLARMDYGTSVSTIEEGRYPVLKMGHLQDGEIRFSDLDFVDEVDDNLILEEGDLLYNRTNSPDQVGKAAVFRKARTDAITFASYLVRLRVNHRANAWFLNYVFNSSGFLGFARRLAIPSVQQSNLNSTRYSRMFIPLPPVGEQASIRDYLDEKIGEVDHIVTGIESQIAILTAYRKSLIHECVTGQRRITEEDLNRVAGHEGKAQGISL